MKRPGVPSNAVMYRTPDGLCFYGPPGVDWKAIRAAGRMGGLSLAWVLIAQGGLDDLQRDDNNVYPAYANAANYAVGVYMSGYPEGAMDLAGEAYGMAASGNYGNNNWLQWWGYGWSAANAGKLPRPSTSNCGCN